ncbi:hypothetical protein BO79DRAFT_220424 [Aspergillus costaricaensis CBS 115574]|uniref:Uncharacterized protein n=1 Tax=Aspergillus costaricaensis CBS 115574 TaxID=1448317 RepID=A0ACD1I7R0_9EURO|nr:hypothetical protein BO79DRAFT_220424 [Aspergillus costaricaensis CBS 115574]RAK85798.1 hypothetical protein BO79DRAFT_220424 [Aspergillus costaricaensis CBS 115574]
MLAYLQDRSVTWGQDARTGKDPVFKWLKLFLYDQEHPILRETPNPALPDVCDIGGGTTDVGAFHIQGTGSNTVYEPLGRPSGVNLGVAASNAAIRQHMKELPPHIFGLVRPLNEALLDRICDLKCAEEFPELHGGQYYRPDNGQHRSTAPTRATSPVSWGATYRGILGRAIPRLYFDASYGLQAAEGAIIRDGSINLEQSSPHWIIRKDHAVESQHQNELFFDIHYRAGNAPITIINLLRHIAEFSDANNGESERMPPLSFHLQGLNLSCLMRVGDEYSVKVQITWEVRYSERQAIVRFTARSQNALLGEQDVPLGGCRLVE